MADQCEVIEEQGFFTVTTNPTFITVINETGTCSSSVQGFRGVTVIETAHGADTLSYVRASTILETGHGTDMPVPLAHHSVTVAERLRAVDSLRSFRGYTINEAGVLADAPSFIRYTVIAEAGKLTATATPLRHPTSTLHDIGTLRDTLTAIRSMMLAETGHGSDTLFTTRSAVLAEAGVLADLIVTAGLKSGVLYETGVLASMVTQLLHAQMVVEEEVFADACGILPAQGNGWTANTDTWGMSRYAGMTFNSLAVIGDVLHAAGDAGLYRLDNDADDAGTPIAAGIDTAITDMGNAAYKQLGYSYIGLTQDGTMLLQVTSAESAHAKTYTYAFEDRNIDDGMGFNATRAKPGKGIESRYWKFGLRNSAGADFSLDDWIVLYDLKSKKVR